MKKKSKHILLSLTPDILERVDRAAVHYGMTRQEMIRFWIAEKVQLLVGDKKNVSN